MTDLTNIANILSGLGYILDAEQPHIEGERFLMAKEKLVLVGTRQKDGLRVAIKISNRESGKKDIRDEKRARDLLESISFADGALLFPKEIFWGEKDGYLIWVIEFIEQEKVFVAYTLEEQFFFALKAFEAQEGFHATTYEHLETVKKIFPVLYGQDYFREFREYKKIVEDASLDSSLGDTLSRAEEMLLSHKSDIDDYANYLTHTDFVPHNFRIRKNLVYILDCAPEYRTVHFGNKYEGWARFLNYMVIHNPSLERLLARYIRDNRGMKDFLNLRLMRAYKIGFLLKFYAESLANTSGDLRTLTLERIDFWHEILKYVLDDREIPEDFVERYKKKRDALRSEEEKKRQREFAVA
ncbi:aminoglycoside phosphotransferase family protein [Candidatus Parcubacteria bacterium]|nr:aminoglycoside phosphotransferase family protein [Candidatus Parcubacteria bacterium]